MLTPQDIQEQEFAKAVFGGYDMAAVDDFLEQVETDYTALYKDNAVLKSKLKVLVDKVEEYRSTEDAMRMALLTAQRMSDDMLADTKKKCEEMIAEAQREAAEAKNGVTRDLTLEQQRLEAAKSETAKFVTAAQKLVNEQAEFLSKIRGMTAEFEEKAVEAPADEPVRSPEPEPGRKVNTSVTPAPAAPETPAAPAEEKDDTTVEIESFVKDIMDSVAADSASLDETRRIDDISEAVSAAINADDSPTKRINTEWTAEDEETTPRPKFKFDDLQFGSNYQEGK